MKVNIFAVVEMKELEHRYVQDEHIEVNTLYELEVAIRDLKKTFNEGYHRKLLHISVEKVKEEK